MRKLNPGRFRSFVFTLAALALIGCGTAPGAVAQGLPADCKVPEAANLSTASIVQATGESLQHKRWQPRGGVIQFTVKSFEGLPANTSFSVCFRWKITNPDNKAGYVQVMPDRLDRNNDGTVWTITVTIPQNFPPQPAGQKSATAFPLLPLVPLADVRIMISKDNNKTLAATVDTTIGITYPWAAIGFAIATVLIALAILALVSRYRLTHPGIRSASLPLRIISTPSGYASLSQLQIVLWTLVVAASAVYVMSLSGDLIQVTEGTLVLLGIAGAAGVTAKVHNESQIAKAQNVADVAQQKANATAPQQVPPQQPAVQPPPVQQPAAEQPAAQQPPAEQAAAQQAATQQAAAPQIVAQPAAAQTPQQAAAAAHQVAKNMVSPPANQVPRWSDLIVTESVRDGVVVREVDVARFQMLLFLLITVVFVLLNVLTTYVIPEIPIGFLTLMGISNGVYLGSKVAQGS